jgi:hypothetical protein
MDIIYDHMVREMLLIHVVYQHFMLHLVVSMYNRIATCLWPLFLSFRHQRRMAKRLARVTKVTRLSDLLAIRKFYFPVCYYHYHFFDGSL